MLSNDTSGVNTECFLQVVANQKATTTWPVEDVGWNELGGFINTVFTGKFFTFHSFNFPIEILNFVEFQNQSPMIEMENKIANP